MLPMDHAIEEPDYTELERPLALVEGLARADVIKTWYTGDPESFRRVLDYSPVPVVVAGGAEGGQRTRCAGAGARGHGRRRGRRRDGPQDLAVA